MQLLFVLLQGILLTNPGHVNLPGTTALQPHFRPPSPPRHPPRRVPCGAHTCPAMSTRPNFIVLRPGSQGAAGLNDRSAIFKWFGNLAWALCARLVVPRPCDMLHPQHNFGHKVDCNLTWDDFVGYRNPDGSAVPYVESSDVFLGRQQLRQANETATATVYSARPSDVPFDFLRVRELVHDEGTAVTWIINAHYYKFSVALAKTVAPVYPGLNWPRVHWGPKDNILNGRHGGCAYVHEHVSDKMAALRDACARHLDLHANETYSVLHIRRRDRLKESCKTDVASVASLVRCQRETQTLDRTLLVMSDEREGTYLRELEEALQAVVRGGSGGGSRQRDRRQRRVVMVDRALRDAEPSLLHDNFRVYAILMALQRRAAHVTELRGDARCDDDCETGRRRGMRQSAAKNKYK